MRSPAVKEQYAKCQEPPAGYRLLTQGDLIRSDAVYFKNSWKPTRNVGGCYYADSCYPMAEPIRKTKTKKGKK